MGTIGQYLRKFGMEELATVWVGWDSNTGHIPSIPAAAVVYGSIFLIGQILFHTSKLLPHPVRQYAMDFVKTMTFCAFPFGHGILRKNYGEVGYLSAAIPLVTLSSFAFANASGNPVGVWQSYYKKHIPFWKCLLQTVIQICAGFSAYRLGMFVLNLQLHPIYVDRLKNYYNSFCTTDLKVPMYVGFIIEFCGVIYESWFSSHTFVRNPLVNQAIKVINAALLVSAGVHLTGMYLHPAMATGHTFGCGDTPRIAHILIYWVGPLIGAWLSLQIQAKLSLTGKKTTRSPGKKSKVTISSKVTVVEDINGNVPYGDGLQKRRKRKFYYS